jgi:hypothetical protein
VIAGEGEFEEYLSGEGWTIFHPEQRSFLEQLSHYVGADKLLFSDGSACHSLMLLPNLRAEIAVVLRRRWHENSFGLQFRGLGQTMTALQHVIKIYSLGMPDYAAIQVVDYLGISRDLIRLGFVENEFSAWASIEDKVIKKGLSKYVNAIANDPRFLAFIESLPS